MWSVVHDPGRNFLSRNFFGRVWLGKGCWKPPKRNSTFVLAVYPCKSIAKKLHDRWIFKEWFDDGGHDCIIADLWAFGGELYIYIYSILSIFLGRTFWRETNVFKNQHNSRSCVSQLRAFSCLSGGHCSVFQSNFWNTEATGNSFQLVFFLADLFRSSGPWERLGTAGGVSRRWPPHAADPAENWNDWAISPMPAAVTLEGWGNLPLGTSFGVQRDVHHHLMYTSCEPPGVGSNSQWFFWIYFPFHRRPHMTIVCNILYSVIYCKKCKRCKGQWNQCLQLRHFFSETIFGHDMQC